MFLNATVNFGQQWLVFQKKSVFVIIKLVYMNQATTSPQKKNDHPFFPSLFFARFPGKVCTIANAFLLT